MSPRPYRSKRHRPCDQCRERKLGCQTEDGLPCLRCRSADLPCSFDLPPPKRLRRGSSLGQTNVRTSSMGSPVSRQRPSSAWEETPGAEPVPTAATSRAPSPGPGGVDPPRPAFAHIDDLPVASGASPALSGHMVPGPSVTQFVQSLDQLEGFSAQLFGASAESDPWLLRHCSFDDGGVKGFYKVHFRNAGGVPTFDKIPVHFMIAADDLAASAKRETSCRTADGATREELNRLVPLDCGQRLVSLWVSPSVVYERDCRAHGVDSSSTSFRRCRSSPARSSG